MLHILRTQIKIGQRPDYAMRLGKMDVYHKANIYFFSHERRFLDSDLISNRSLQAVAVGTRDVLKNPSFISFDTNRRLAITRRVVLNTRTGFIMIRLRLPVTIAKDKFDEMCEHFWKVIFPRKKL